MYDARSKQDSNAIEIGHDVPASHRLSPGQGEQMLHDGAIASILATSSRLDFGLYWWSVSPPIK